MSAPAHATLTPARTDFAVTSNATTNATAQMAALMTAVTTALAAAQTNGREARA